MSEIFVHSSLWKPFLNLVSKYILKENKNIWFITDTDSFRTFWVVSYIFTLCSCFMFHVITSYRLSRIWYFAQFGIPKSFWEQPHRRKYKYQVCNMLCVENLNYGCMYLQVNMDVTLWANPLTGDRKVQKQRIEKPFTLSQDTESIKMV